MLCGQCKQNAFTFTRMDILDAKYLISNPNVRTCPAADRPEIAFIGRSNVGKSSLINMLMSRQGLAKTSATPGKTQMINHFGIRSRKDGKDKQPIEWYLVDLPGYGYAKVSQKDRKQWSRMLEQYFTERENLVNTFVLIDARHEPQKIDLEFINQMGAWELPFSIVFTKADKVKPMALKRNTDQFMQLLSEHWQYLPASFISSATEKTGKEELHAWIQQMLDATAGNA